MEHILLTGLLLGSLTVQAQVSGMVKDQAGEPIIGANAFWKNIPDGVATREDGIFSISKPDRGSHPIVSFVGYENNTIQMKDKNAVLDVVPREGMELSEVNIVSRKLSILKLRNSVMNEEVITNDKFRHAACCNLGESLVTNPSVDVSYSNTATGAKQIKLLGLSGTCVQMLTENILNYHGVASPYGLGYVPGPWMHSIRVSKGISSVKNGYEALTGQINIEFKKPRLPEMDWVSVNLFASTTNRYEANTDATVKLSKRRSTSLLAHYENETKAHGDNDGNFADTPRIE